MKLYGYIVDVMTIIHYVYFPDDNNSSGLCSCEIDKYNKYLSFGISRCNRNKDIFDVEKALDVAIYNSLCFSKGRRIILQNNKMRRFFKEFVNVIYKLDTDYYKDYSCNIIIPIIDYNCNYKYIYGIKRDY